MNRIVLLFVFSVCLPIHNCVRLKRETLFNQQSRKLHDNHQNPNPNVKIAIVGSGIGGASASYFVKQVFQDKQYTLDVFEKSDSVGGRLKTIDVDGFGYEAGGSVIHSRNKYMKQFSQWFGESPSFPTVPDAVMALYDGEKFILNELKSNLQILTRYGISLATCLAFVDDMLNHFDNIYKHQAKNFAFTSVKKLLASMDSNFPSYLDISIKDKLRNLNISDLLIDELVAAANSVNYGQSTDIHAFVSAVSLAGFTGSLFSVKGGNQKVPERLLYEANPSNVYFNTTVNAVSFDETRYYVRCNNSKTLEYDIVILATPFVSNADVESKIQLQSINKHEIHYHSTVSSFFHGGDINYDAFDHDCCSQADQQPNEIISVDATTDWQCFALQSPVDRKGFKPAPSDLFKLFTEAAPSSAHLDNFFSSHSQPVVQPWLAYPEYNTFEAASSPAGSFQLHRHVYHINAIEIAASAMEMSVIGARNCVNLAFNNFYNHSSSVDP